MDSSTSATKRVQNVLLLFFLWSMCLGEIFLWCSEKSNFKPKVSTGANQKKLIKRFKFWPMKKYKPKGLWLRLAYKNGEIATFATFCRVHSNSKEVYPLTKYVFLFEDYLLNKNFSYELKFFWHLLRSETTFSKWKAFKNVEKRFLFHLKSSFCSQDI